MLKDIVEFLSKKRIVLKSMTHITPKELGSRKKVDIFLGVDMKDYYNLIIYISKKSRFIRKDTEDIINLHYQTEKLKDIIISKKIILINAPLCSKAKKMLTDEGWIVFEILK